jgi:hypothetical protein
MPNWASNRLTLSGPHAEIMRFRNTCIRVALEEDSDKECFDLGALVPMPPVIVATLEGRSAEAKQAAADATGFETWYDWCIAHWGCKWNTSNLQVITTAPDLIDIGFETAWSAPEPAFAALAVQFPLLSGRVCVIEEGMDWGLIGEFQAGSYTPTYVDVSTELKFLVYAWGMNGRARLNIGRVLAQPSSDEQEPGDGVLERVWAALGQTLAPEFMARLSFEVDVQRFNDWHDTRHGVKRADSEVCQLHDVMRTPLNAEFLSAEGRCRYSLDRNVMGLLAQNLTAEWGRSPDATQIESDLRRDVTDLLSHHSEGELSEWACHAMIRHKSNINFTDLASLQESFIVYARGLREQILQHLACVQVVLMSCSSRQAAPGRAPDPLSSRVTLS